MAATVSGQREAKLELSDDAPRLSAEEWLKGAPISEYAEGEAYVIDFWATWCGPCIRSMPHLSEVQEKFEDKGLTVVAVNVEDAGRSVSDAKALKIREFVKKNEERMGFTVMLDDGVTDRSIRQAAGYNSIPMSVIIDKKGRVAWTGHPLDDDFDSVVEGVLDDSYDVGKIVEARRLAKAAIADFRAERRAAAFEKIDRVRDLDPSRHSRLVIDRLQITAMDDSPEDALPYATDLIDRVFASDARSLGRIAGVLNRMETDDALTLARRAGALAIERAETPVAGLFVIHGETLSMQGDYAKAIELLERAKPLSTSTELKTEIETRLAEYQKLSG
ncbi:MAG: redoxin family protein [Planctomycetota bacterium]